jgi:inner membrane protein involved in colicin E2 resistance
VLLLSISEHLLFGTAYFISSVSILILVTAYARVIFKNNMLTGVFAAIFAILYVFLFLVAIGILFFAAWEHRTIYHFSNHYVPHKES